LYFGANGGQTDWFISRAYLDMCRTLHYRDMNGTRHKLSQEPNCKELVENAQKALRMSLCELQKLRHDDLARLIRQRAPERLASVV